VPGVAQSRSRREEVTRRLSWIYGFPVPEESVRLPTRRSCGPSRQRLCVQRPSLRVRGAFSVSSPTNWGRVPHSPP